MSKPQALAFAGDAARPQSRPPIKCQVRVTTNTGERFRYAALFASTCDAVIDAISRFGVSKISVKSVQ